MTQQLPQQVILTFEGDDDDFKVHAKVQIVGTEDATYNLGRMYQEGGDIDHWEVEYGTDCRNHGDTDVGLGPMAAVGLALDNALSDETPDEEGEDEDEEDDRDEDEDDFQDVKHLSGREWIMISRTEDSITRGMDVGNGCLIRSEIFGDDDGEFSSSLVFVPDSNVAKILALGD